MTKTCIITFVYKAKKYTATVEQTPTEYKVSPHHPLLVLQFGDESTLYKDGSHLNTLERGTAEFEYLNAIAKRLFMSALFQ